jgi:osmotically-inducible protein OsmY
MVRVVQVLGWPVRAAVAAARAGWLAGRATRATGRVVGGRRLALVAAGVAVGLLVAPVPGRVLRSRVRAGLAARRPAPEVLADRVRAALGSAQRTWHLPQPAVAVTDGRRVVLTGEVPHDTGRRDLVAVAAAVPGVAGVDDRLDVPGTGPAH